MPYIIESPFPSFNDTDGSPLNNGYVYVGSPNLNPVTDPIPVYWDAALTQPAAQPIRTINGYLSRNGSPGRIYTNFVTYSFRVTNNKGEQVFSDLNYTDPSSNAGSTYQQVITAIAGQTVFTLSRTYVPGANNLFVYRNGLRLIAGQDYNETGYSEVTLTAGADNGDEFVFDIGYNYDAAAYIDAQNVTYKLPVATSVFRDVEAKLAESVSVKDFGAVGDGTTDDTAAFIAAAATNSRVLVPSGSYYLTSSVPGYFLADTDVTWSNTYSAGGDELFAYTTGLKGQLFDFRLGSTASPDTVNRPAIKVSRTTNIPKPGSSDLCDEMAAITGICAGTVNNEGQTVGVLGVAKSSYNAIPTNVQGDACGLYGLGRFNGVGQGTAIGIFATGRRDTSTGRATAGEFATQNYGGAATTYNPTGYSQGTGLWVTCIGNADSGVGIALGNPFGQQFDVGLAFNGQVTGGKTGPVSGICIRDDSNATTFMDIRGTHSNAAILIRSGAGNISVGTTVGVSSYKIYAQCNQDTNSALVGRANSATQIGDILRIENSSGVSLFSISGNGNANSQSSGGVLQVGRFSTDTNPASATLNKSRNATVGSHTIVNTGDLLGIFRFAGSDGSAFIVGSQIYAQTYGTPATNDIRSSIDLATRGSDGLNTRMRIGTQGDVYLRSLGTELATSTTEGFTYIPTVNGVASGVPANTLTGTIPMIYDRANNKIGIYNGGWKWTAALA